MPESEQGHRSHRGRPQHARFGTREQQEAEDPQHADEVEATSAHANPAGHQQREPHQQGEVCSGDGEQVSQSGGAELCGQACRGVHRQMERDQVGLGNGVRIQALDGEIEAGDMRTLLAQPRRR